MLSLQTTRTAFYSTNGHDGTNQMNMYEIYCCDGR